MLRPKRQTSATVTVTAPIGGWNVISSLATMPPSDAVIIDNWFCLPTELMVRKGYTQYATGITGNVKSFLNYDAPDGTSEIYAVADNSGSCAIYDVSTQGAVGAAVVSGLTNAEWNHAQITNTGGTFTTAVNGHDYARIYNGTTWQTVTGVSTPLAITGIDTRSLIDIKVHKRRTWFVEKDSMSCWYLATDAISGAATEFDFGPIFAQGGHIVKIDTWTLDAGTGMDDYFVVATSAGEVAVYSGTNPASATDWQLNGVYYVGAPVGRQRCTCKYGGDLLLLNKDGLIPISQALMSSRVSTRMTITNKIQSRITADTSTYFANYGWDVVLFPPENMLIINVPISTTVSYQYVMNTITGAWSRWTDLNAMCLGFYNEQLFFGSGGTVYKAWDGTSDDGNNIVTDLLPAFSPFGSQSQIKLFKMSRIFMGSDSAFAYAGQINVNFDTVSQPQINYASPSTTAATWNSSLWDTAIWGGDITPFTQWVSAGRMGHYGSYRIKTASYGADVRYYSTDYVYEGGGIL